MKNKLDEIIKERLENRLEWKNYLSWLDDASLKKNLVNVNFKNIP